MTRDYRHFIDDILTAIQEAEAFTAGMSVADFARDRKTLLAVIRCLEIVGEAAKSVPDTVKRRYPVIPWKRMAGMRDKLIHGYFGIDTDILWIVVKEELPPLKGAIALIKKDLGGA